MDAVELTQELIRIDSTNPPGNEAACVSLIARLLADWGLEVRLIEYQSGRCSIVARLPGRESAGPLCFTGHIDTVPFGAASWRHDPLGAELEGNRLFGRGASDMKSGLAAVLVSINRLCRERIRLRDVWLLFTVAEETGCCGAQTLVATPGILPQAGALVVAEPTGNRVAIAHKGAVRLQVEFKGKSAHGSMPELGENAILAAARGALKLGELDLGTAEHPQLGRTTLNVGTIKGGSAINMVPDHAEIGLDIRTIPGNTSDSIGAAVRRALGGIGTVSLVRAAEPIATRAEHPWVEFVCETTAAVTGRSGEPIGVPYFTDASFLTPGLQLPPTVVIGPGEPSQAHATDEWCDCEAIRASAELYHALAQSWCLRKTTEQP